MIISVHLPKTAGESFAASLKEHFKEKFHKDVSDKPINTPTIRRNTKAIIDLIKNGFNRHHGIDCIHGHFLPLKYGSLAFRKEVIFVTWLRDPVERMASHYHYWRRNYHPETAPPLYQKMMDEDWSLENFCFRKELQNFYSQFLWGFPISQFSFIGIVEHYEEDFNFFRYHILNTPLSLYKINYNPDKHGIRYINDEVLRQRIARFHQKDMNLYNSILERRVLRKK